MSWIKPSSFSLGLAIIHWSIKLAWGRCHYCIFPYQFWVLGHMFWLDVTTVYSLINFGYSGICFGWEKRKQFSGACYHPIPWDIGTLYLICDQECSGASRAFAVCKHLLTLPLEPPSHNHCWRLASLIFYSISPYETHIMGLFEWECTVCLCPISQH